MWEIVRDSVEGEEGEYEAPGLERGGGWDDILELLVMSGFYDHRMLMVWRLEGGWLHAPGVCWQDRAGEPHYTGQTERSHQTCHLTLPGNRLTFTLTYLWTVRKYH